MNSILKFFDEKFVVAFFKKNILPAYSDFLGIKKIKIKPHKNYVWDETYHVVLEFETYFITQNGKIKKLPIFCSAHSSESRRNLYRGLKYLWDKGFSKGYLSIPHPLFYSEKFRAVFYRGVNGKNFYQYIKDNNREEIKNLVSKTAIWFSKLHSLPAKDAPYFNKKNSRIKTSVPGADKILSLIGLRYPQYKEDFEKFYAIFIKKEELFLKNIKRRWLVHGDAHPENVIKMGRHKIALIDFNDLCLSDFARDLGSFLQQFDYMASRKINDKTFIDEMKKLFLDSYLSASKIKIDDSLQERIDNYYNWTAVRTAIFLLLKVNPKPDKACELIGCLRKKYKNYH